MLPSRPRNKDPARPRTHATSRRRSSGFLDGDGRADGVDARDPGSRRQLLEEVLGEFEGTLLFVSHDRYFIDSLATKVWVIEDRVLIPYWGNYTDYRTRKRPIVLDVPAAPSSNSKGLPASPTAPKRPASLARSGSKKAEKPKVRTVEDVEREIEKVEARVKKVEEALNEAALNADGDRLTQLSTEYERLRAQSNTLLAEWERLAKEAL